MRTAKYGFVLLFLAIITLPLIFVDTKSTISKNENRTLAVFPAGFEPLSFSKSLDAYIKDRFGFRNEAVGFMNNFKMKDTFRKGNVVFGKNDWLFYADEGTRNNIFDFLKINLFSQNEIEKIIKNVENRAEWCSAHNIKFIFLIAPNKHNVYPEYYPVERPAGITRTDQIMNARPDNLKDRVLYPRDFLLSKKTTQMPIYYETDSHWNMLGASYAYDLISKKIKNDFPNTIFPDIKFITDVTYDSSGDIVPMSGLTSYGKRTIPDVHPEDGWSSYYTYIKKEGNGSDGIITKNKNSDLPKAIIFRDSFFFSLEPFTSTLFSSAEYNWREFNDNEKDYILENKPDIIIWEVAERLIPDSLNSPWN